MAGLGLVVLALALTATTVHAQSEATLAQDHLKLGTKAFKAKRYQDALDELVKAAKYGELVEKRDLLHFNIGVCLQKLGRLPEAVASFERALGFSGKEANRARIQKRIDAVAPKAFGILTVECPTAAQVSVAGGAPKPCPGTWERVAIGPQEVAGKTADGLAAKTKVTVVAGERVSTQLSFPGGLAISFQLTDSVVLVDGMPRGVAPLQLDDLTPGKHAVAIRMPGQPDVKLEADIKAGERLVLGREAFVGLAEVLTVGSSYTGWAWTTLGLGLASVGVGAYYELRGQDEFDAFCSRSEYDCDTEKVTTIGADAGQLEAEKDEANGHRILGQVLMGIGGALVATSVTLFVLDGGDASASGGSALHFAPRPDGAAVVWRGAF